MSSTQATAAPTASTRQMPSTRYCVVALLGTVALLVAVAGFDIAVDPYLVFDAPRIAGFNAFKAVTIEHADLAKSALLARSAPRTLALGTSKVDIGIDPDSEWWPQESRPVFNDGRPGSNIRAIALELQRAVASAAPPRRVFLMLDLPEFMVPVGADAPAPTLGTEGVSGLADRIGEFVNATVSLDALIDSVTTVFDQSRAHVVNVTDEGSTNDALFEGPIAQDGAHLLFQQKDATYGERTRALAHELRRHPGTAPAQMGTVRAIIALCRAHGIALDLAIAPFHADYLELMSRAGLWERYEQTKAAIVAAVAAEGGPETRLWDFMGFDRYSTETVPGPGAGAAPRWFWEPGHFRKALGERILANVYGGAGDYGARLTPETLPTRLAADRQARDAYELSGAGSSRVAEAAR